jgi:hypothetical protein
MTTGRSALPSHVAVFWWLSIAVVALWIFWTGKWLLFPSSHYLTALAKLPVQFREGVQHLDIELRVWPTLFWGAETLGLAWFAAFGRRNWARWAYAIVFVLREVGFAIAMAVNDWRFRDVLHKPFLTWGNPVDYVVPLLTIAAIIFVFTGNARRWFEKLHGECPANATNN